MSRPAFFYGSYMDDDVLRKYGTDPGPPTSATLTGWRLTFTPHADLVRDDGTTVHGVVMQLSQEDLDRLYGPDGFVTTYHPQKVTVHTEAGGHYLTTFVDGGAEQSPPADYVGSLLSIMRKVGVPDDYIAEVEAEARRLSA